MGGDITPSLYINWVWGGYHPPVRESVENGVDFPPGGDIPPLCLYGLGQPVFRQFYRQFYAILGHF